MTRIARQFSLLSGRGAKGFIPFVTAGDPNLAVSLQIVLELARLGASVIELGVPFSDPMADGPTIQLSSQRALKNNVNLAGIFDLVRKARETIDVPIVLFSYFNPLLQFGVREVAETAAKAGVDGILITDVVDDEAEEIAAILQASNIDLISLIAPTTSDERLARIAAASSGFVYAVSRAGVTGARTESSSAAETLVARARRYFDLPVAVGFGISTNDQIEDVWRYADAAVVGSAIVAEIEKANNPNEAVERVVNFVSGLLPQFAKSPGEI